MARPTDHRDFHKLNAVENSNLNKYNALPNIPSRVEHDSRRYATYPKPISNTWYVSCLFSLFLFPRNSFIF